MPGREALKQNVFETRRFRVEDLPQESLVDRDGASLDDLLSHLEDQTERRRAEDVDPRPDRGPRIPQTKDRWVAPWAPPPERRNNKIPPGFTTKPEFVRFVPDAGKAFHANPGYLKPNVLSPRTIQRLNQPDRTFAHLPSQIYGHAHSETIPEPTDDMCDERHARWLQDHYKQRDRHINQVYHARIRVEKATKILKADETKRQIARDLLSQGQMEMPHLSSAARSGIMKLKRAVKTTRAFRSAASDAALAAGDTDKAASLNPMKAQEEKNKMRLKMSMSAPCLRLKEPTPRGVVSHIHNFQGTDRTGRHFRSSTPWRTEDEFRDLGIKPWGSTGPRRLEVLMQC
eukprot:TRINITY_DN31055_c0_g1_i1.p1 TRINITY_DN31055_c0_g1~~TRINITY_DN31055_c0_g1_i1.p1  ORF type:complete len:344 (+),score=48.96 TRINITY_DN31055_c0_g1_i1:76-1107(+)